MRVWDLTTGTPLGDPLAGHAGMVSAVAVGQLDGRPVAITGGRDGTVLMWSLTRRQKRLCVLSRSSAQVTCLAVGRIRRRDAVFASGTDGFVRVIDVQTGKRLAGIAFPHPVTGLAGDGDDGIVVCYDREVAYLRPHRSPELDEDPTGPSQ